MSLQSYPPFSLIQREKNALFLDEMAALTRHHQDHCPAYRSILNRLNCQRASLIADLPFLPVQLFKILKLVSVPDDAVVRIMRSSGTGGDAPSQIFLDQDTALKQVQALAKIGQHFWGKKRRPMLILDTPAITKEPLRSSARAAGVLGFSTFGRDHCYALDENYQLQTEVVENFIRQHDGSPLLLMGFTFMVWQYFYKPLHEKDLKLNLPDDSFLLHGGGWKKLQDQSVHPEHFRISMQEQLGRIEVRNYYGMIEQVGSIFIECSAGHLHAPAYAEIMVRNERNLEPCAIGEEGLIQVFSVLPKSYPGHSLLTEDRGKILGEDNCPCGLPGRYFQVLGRVNAVPLRGCSDTHIPIQVGEGR
ncbi:MAG TPA: acyl-protein synthetase [Kiritimatiellia bacterium]|nr:acyl-protein synthetase [Kiritimatiellia bacterium]